MTKAKISEYDAVASNNTDVNGVNIAENCPPSGMNNMGREIMAALKRFQVGSDGDGVTVGGNLVVSGTSTVAALNTSGAVVFNDAGADVDFRVESDTVENALFVDGATGNVGIGTSSPASYSSIGYRLVVGDGSGNEGITIATGTGDNGSLLFADGTSGSAAFAGYVQYDHSDNSMKLGTNGSESMRIDSSGNLLVGTTSVLDPGNVQGVTNLLNPNNDGKWALAVQNNGTTATYGRGIGIRFATDYNNTSNEALFFIGNATPRFIVRSNGGIANYSANDANLSDRREKTNFAPAKNYLDTICAIPVQTFNYIDQSEDDPGLTLGVVAQDVQEVAPELVMESNWGTEEEPKMRLSIYQTDLQYALMKSIQELKAELDTVKAELATLKG